ncbi:MAG: hypothetical protein OSA02_06120, partial [Schleiferiaceae bacterium]|nr:hypothetical protein [Schleiferiaceae bacterium]
MNLFGKLQSFLESTWMDVFGVGLILAVSFKLGFHNTVINGIPIGWFSTIGAGFSMMVTRLVTK